MYIIIGFFASLLIAPGIFIGCRDGDWTFVALPAGVAVVLFAILRYLKLEIREDGFTYRNLTMHRSVALADIEAAFFETLRASMAPQGVAVFWIRLRDGKAMKINLETFSIRAAAMLFTALERHDIPIDVPDTWACRLKATQIRKEQARLPGQPGTKENWPGNTLSE